MSLLIFLSTFVIILATTVVILRRVFQQTAARHRRVLLSTLSKDENTRIAGFLHPYCNAGGGGERVLFAAISYLQTSEPHLLSIVYTGDVDSNGQPLAKSEILKRCKERFGIELDEGKVEFVHLKWRWLVEDSTWKRFTMLGQGLGAALLGAEAMWRLIPDVFLDTHGLAFSYPVARFLSGGSTMPILAYIHYPTISSAMLSRVSNREMTYANDAQIASSAWRSTAKLLYYRLFSFIYTAALRVPQPGGLMVNSSWTGGHVTALLATRTRTVGLSPLDFMISLVSTLVGWGVPRPQGINEPPKDTQERLPRFGNVRRIYPPCDVQALRDFSLKGRRKVVFSCAQFRPEKDHAKQIRAFALLFKAHPELFAPKEASIPEPAAMEQSWLHVDPSSSTATLPARNKEKSGSTDSGLKLVLLGSARHKEDLERVETLRGLTKKLGIESHVEFRLNAPYQELLRWLSVSSIGISTMIEEHFGIGVVEFMGAGLIPVVHASGGPIMDIVIPVDGRPTGFHAGSAEEFAEQLYAALQMDEDEALEMRARARESSARFSTLAFEQGFGALWEDVKKAL